MQSTYATELSGLSTDRPYQPRLRAIVEFVEGELLIYPIADSDHQARAILDAFRLLREAFRG